MTEPIIVVGAGGFGRETLDVINAINDRAPTWSVVGVADDSPSDANLLLLDRRGVRFLGGVAEVIANIPPSFYAVGVGSPVARRSIAGVLDDVDFKPGTLVHPSATIGFDVEIGDGSIVCAGVRLTTNIRIGRHVHANLNATVGHDSTIGDFVSLNPLASISGDCTIDDGALIGVGGVVLNQVTVGAGATVGGSACVVRDVPPGVTVKGVPAR